MSAKSVKTIALIFVLLLLGAAFFVFCEEKGKPTDILLTIFTGLLVLFTGLLWASTNDLVVGAQRTAKSQLRAYMAQACIEPETNKFQMAVKVKNEGETPAKDTIIKIFVSVIEPVTVNGIKFNYVSNPQLLQRKQGFTAQVPIDQGAASARAANAKLYVYGEISYADIFLDSWITQFCFEWVSERRAWEPYAKWNTELPGLISPNR